MASGIKPTPWPAPCSRGPKMAKKFKIGPETVALSSIWTRMGPYGLKLKKTKQFEQIGRELDCGSREPSPLFLGSRKQWYKFQVPTPLKTPYVRGGGLGALKGSLPSALGSEEPRQNPIW